MTMIYRFYRFYRPCLYLKKREKKFLLSTRKKREILSIFTTRSLLQVSIRFFLKTGVELTILRKIRIVRGYIILRRAF